MKRLVVVSALVGFCVPICLGVLGLPTLNDPQSPAATMLWLTIQVTCPPWLIPDSWTPGSFVATMVLNAVLYGSVAGVGALAARALGGRVGRTVRLTTRAKPPIAALGVLGAAAAILPAVTDGGRWPHGVMAAGACVAIVSTIAFGSVRPQDRAEPGS